MTARAGDIWYPANVGCSYLRYKDQSNNASERHQRKKKFAKPNTSQRLADQPKLILKKGWFSGHEILEICGQINSEEYTQRELSKQVEILNTENQTITDPSTTTSILTQDREHVDLIKKIMNEQKITLPSLRNQNWKKVMVKTEKVNKLLKYIPTDNITEMNEINLFKIKISH